MLGKLILGRCVSRIEPLQLIESLTGLADRVPPSGRKLFPCRIDHVTGGLCAAGALGGDCFRIALQFIGICFSHVSLVSKVLAHPDAFHSEYVAATRPADPRGS
jgi:hypothetical protein